MKNATRLIAFLALLPLASGQYYIISTVAGNGQLQFTGAGGPANTVSLVNPRYVAAAGGNLYVSDSYYNQVFQITAGGTINVAAGNGRQGFSGDGGPAAAAQLDGPAGVAADAAGNLYIADAGNSRIRKVSPLGVITTVAGNGSGGVSGDGGSAISAAVGTPAGLGLDAAGNLYITQATSHVVRQLRTDGTITAFAGTGTAGFSGNGSAATAAMLSTPRGVKVDTAGNVYIADTGNSRVRKITPQGIISTVAGNGSTSFAGDGGQATAAAVGGPADIAIDSNNNLYIADNLSLRVRMVNAAGVISTFSGGGSSFANGPAAQATLPGINGLAVEGPGTVVVVVSFARQVRRVAQQTITTVAGALPVAGAGDNVSATSTSLLDPYGVAVDTTGNLYVSDLGDNRVRKISPAGIITTAAGTGVFGTSGDGGPATSALLGLNRALSADPSGNLYMSSFGASIRRISTSGVISTVAGSGSAGFSGDGGSATAAQLVLPLGVVADAAGNMWIADTGNNRIRRVDAATRIITTIAGTGPGGFSGDNGPAISAQLSQPQQLALDRSGNLFIADTGNNRIRKISPAGVITTVAGTGGNAFAGDGGPATSAQILASGVAVDVDGNLYIAGGSRVRKVDASSGIIATIAGTGTAGFSGDGGLGTNAALDAPLTVAVDATGNVYISDSRNQRVRKLALAQIVPEGVANGGTLRAGAVAPGEIISIFGFAMGPATGVGLELDANGRVSTQLAGTQVLFDGVAAPLLYVSATQVNAVAPYGIVGASSTRLQVMFQGRATNTISLPVAASSPGLFAITNQDGRVNSGSNPAAEGSVLILYGTGEGQTDPPGVDGNVATAVFPKPLLPVTVQVGGRAATVQYAGAAPGFVSGVLQLNIQLPAGLTGTVPMQVRIGEATTPAGLTVSIR